MADRDHNLAIETSSRRGALALGRGDTLLETVELPQQRRHHVGLMPGIDALCRARDLTPHDLGEVYVALGPGSFTGLRVAVAAVKMLALARDMKIVGVPSLDVLARNAPAEPAHTAVCLNAKRGTVYCAVYRQGEMIVPPALRTMDELLSEAPRPLALIAEKLPDDSPYAGRDVTCLSAATAQPRAEAVWRIGRAMAQRGEYADPMTLEPLYIRQPEAVALWDERQTQQSR